MNVFGIDMYVIMSVVLLLGLTLPYVFQKIRQQKDVNKYNITNTSVIYLPLGDKFKSDLNF